MQIINVRGVTKEFRLGQSTSIKNTLQRMTDRVLGRRVGGRPLFKALDGVDLGIEAGEVVGLIGTNGAGKSTLLKLICRITSPSSGTVEVGGSIAPLIEVGAGLHPELTGRENIFLNGAILGIPRGVIRRKIDDIVAFAELEEFIDTPIKRYSSGMKVRLGFAIATSVDADILVVDEVLAVGDLAFQRKCFDRMEELIKRSGKTVLLVSHYIRQVERICDRVVLLDEGKVIADGVGVEVCNLFYQRSNEKVRSYQYEQQRGRQRIRASGEVEIDSIEVLDEGGAVIDEVPSGGMLRVRVRFQVNSPLIQPEIVVGTHTTDFVYLSAASTSALEDRPDYVPGVHEVEYIVPSFPMVAGVYCIRVAFFDNRRRTLFEGETLKMFSVRATGDEVREVGLRTLDIPTEWRIEGRRFVKNTSLNWQETVAS